jgi:hypothetical protein
MNQVIKTTTADGKYSYTELAPDGETLYNHAVFLNRYLSEIYNWNENKITPGSWGADINICRVGYALRYMNTQSQKIPQRVTNCLPESRIPHVNQHVVCINCRNIPMTTTTYITDIAREVHKGWRSCYKYWVTYKPWETNFMYNIPHNGLYSNNKSERSEQSFDELTIEQQQLCIDIALYVVLSISDCCCLFC